MKESHHRPEYPITPSPNYSPRREEAIGSRSISLPFSEFAKPREGGVDLGGMFAAVRRQIPQVLAITATVTAAAVVWTATREAEFEGSFQLLIEPVTIESQVANSLQDGKGGGGVNFEATRLSQDSIDYNTQINVLLSPKLLAPVSQKLKSKYPDLTPDALANNIEIVRYRGRKVTDKGKESGILLVTYRGKELGEVRAALKALSTSYLNYSAKERLTNLGRAVKFVDEQLPSVRGRVEQLESDLQIFRQKYDLVNPAETANQVLAQLSSIEQQRLDVQVQLVQTQSLYKNIQQQLRANTQQAMAASVLSEAPDYQRLSAQLQEIESQIAVQSAQLTDDNPTLKILNERRQKLLPLLQQRERAALGADLHGQVGRSSSLPFQNSVRLGLTKQFLDTANQLRTLESRYRELSRAKITLATRFKQLPTLSRQYDNLQRRLQLETTNLTNLMAKREELRLNVARQEVPWELIAPPTEPSEAKRNILRNSILGAILGSILGVGYALLIDKTKKVVYSPKELKAVIDSKLLGVIPTLRSSEGVVLEVPVPKARLLPAGGLLAKHESTRDRYGYYRYSPFIEAFRSLYTNIRYLRRIGPVQSIVVSSALTGEGKSTVAVNLAKAAAAMGRRVLLVDADLRQPRVHSILNLQVRPGVCELLTSHLSIDDVIQAVPDTEGLSVITAGELQRDATSLLASAEMADLMQIAQTRFSLVIYDTAPLGFADPTLLANNTDGLVVVARLGSIDSTTLREALETVEISGATVLGVVANDASQSIAGLDSYKRKYGLERREENSDWLSVNVKR